MPKQVTFLDTSLPNYADLAKALVSQGWTGVRSTSGNRFQIQVKYAYYLANTLAASHGVNASALGPSDLAAIWEQAGKEASRFEMYVKDESNNGNVEMSNSSISPSEEFATAEDVERMQPHYQDIEDILAGLSGLSFGGKKRRGHKKTARKSKKSRSHKKAHRKANRKANRKTSRKTYRKDKKSKKGGKRSQKTRRNKRN